LAYRLATKPRHDYVFEITSTHVLLRATPPQDAGIDRGEALDDAERSEKDAQKATEELRRRIFG
jgi:hypothetical protein